MSDEPTKLLWDLVKGRLDDGSECRRLVEAGADIHDREGYGSGFTPLMIAAQRNKPRVLSCLVVLGARLNQTDNNGGTAALLAARWGNDECLSLLVSSRADLTMKNNYGYTALDFAQQENEQGCIDILTNALANNNNTRYIYTHTYIHIYKDTNIHPNYI